ncbi:hypothetical protein AAMO2058_000997700 [Amorphochlora amoebiformis]
MLRAVNRHLRRRIGIISGSGPDAGLDLMRKIVVANRKFLGPGAGDKDAPKIAMVNFPEIGGPHGHWDLTPGSEASAELESNMKIAVNTMSTLSDYFCVACNTLHNLQPLIEATSTSGAKFISIVDVVEEYCQEHKIDSLVVMGSTMTTDVKDTSPYAPLSGSVALPVLEDSLRTAQQSALEQIKSNGPFGIETQQMFQDILDSVPGDDILLGCTEFPLMPVTTKKRLIDPTQLLAEKLLALSWGYEDGVLPIYTSELEGVMSEKESIPVA